MQAKAYIYRNLNRGGFSVKYRGKVALRMDSFEARDVEFRVSKASQTRARTRKARNVHAFIVCDPNNIVVLKHANVSRLTPIYYNPFKTDTFVIAGTNEPIHRANYVAATGGKAYVHLNT